jgi:hypothetical protein
MRSKEEFGVSNAAPNAEDMRPWANIGLSENAPDHMSAQGAHGRPCKVLLRKAGVELFVILEFALKSIHLLDDSRLASGDAPDLPLNRVKVGAG